MNTEEAKIIKAIRAQYGLSQMDLAGQLGYSTPQFISNIERGLCGLPVNKINKLAKLFRQPRANKYKKALIAAKKEDFIRWIDKNT